MMDLNFAIHIAAPPARVWDCMFDPLAYRDWTRAFAEGSYFEGEWAAGRRLRFLDPQGFGMEAVVDVCESPQRLSLQLVGEIREGCPVPDSALHATPARETYRFTPQPDGSTQLAVQLQAWDSGFLDFLKDTWPLALQRLKALAESTH